jgi:prepilin-type processing-associated H-X9-DG protein
MVRKSSVVVMIVEAADPNWMQETGQPNINGTGRTVYIRRIGARHGKKTADGLNAYSNVCYFDGHVELKATEPISTADPEDTKNFCESSGFVIYLNRQ